MCRSGQLTLTWVQVTVSRLRDDLQHANEKELLLLEAYETLEGDVGKQVSTCTGRHAPSCFPAWYTAGATAKVHLQEVQAFQAMLLLALLVGGCPEQTAIPSQSLLATDLAVLHCSPAGSPVQTRLAICCRWTRPWPGRLSSWSEQPSRHASQRRSWLLHESSAGEDSNELHMWGQSGMHSGADLIVSRLNRGWL